jgi:hypothetical protein
MTGAASGAEKTGADTRRLLCGGRSLRARARHSAEERAQSACPLGFRPSRPFAAEDSRTSVPMMCAMRLELGRNWRDVPKADGHFERGVALPHFAERNVVGGRALSPTGVHALGSVQDDTGRGAPELLGEVWSSPFERSPSIHLRIEAVSRAPVCGRRAALRAGMPLDTVEGANTLGGLERPPSFAIPLTLTHPHLPPPIPAPSHSRIPPFLLLFSRQI